MRHLFFLVFILSTFSASGQILNIESLRKVTDTSGFTGFASLDFSLKRDKNKYYEIGNEIHVQYKMRKHLVLWKNDLHLKSIEGNKFENSAAAHLRYNYRFHPSIAGEIFVQAQYNKVSKIDFRGLIGLGPRFKLTNHEDYKVYLGVTMMYEQEELDDKSIPVQRDLRGSSYLSFSLHPTPVLSIVGTTYYQPKLRDFKDYRVSSETSLVFNVFTKLAFKTSYVFIYDSYTAQDIPTSQYELKTGVVYNF